MQDVNSINQFNNLKHTLETEDRQIKDIESKIRVKEVDHRRAKEVLDKVEGEIKALQSQKDNIIHRRSQLEIEIRNMQRSLDESKKHGGSQLKL